MCQGFRACFHPSFEGFKQPLRPDGKEILERARRIESLRKVSVFFNTQSAVPRDFEDSSSTEPAPRSSPVVEEIITTIWLGSIMRGNPTFFF